MVRVLQNLRERAIGMLNAGIKMNAVATNISCSSRAVRLDNVFTRQSVRKIDQVVDVRASRRVTKTPIFETPTSAIAYKLPQLLLLTPNNCTHYLIRFSIGQNPVT